MTDPVPLYVDLDGTLTPADVSLEGFVAFAKTGVRPALRLASWLVQGRAVTKSRVAAAMPVDPLLIPVRAEVQSLIDAARAEGRPVILASASDQANVQRIADHLGCFDATWGSSAGRNLKGRNKLAAIRAENGALPFDYIGDSHADVPIWAAARAGYSVGHNPQLPHIQQLLTPPSATRALITAMRLHQWAKNALIFVPLLTAGLALRVPAVLNAALAMFYFSLVASGVYLVNDMLDIAADRAHKTKYKRPLAAGTLSIPQALAAVMVLISAPLISALFTLGLPTALVLFAYLLLTTAYSLRLKAVMTLDVITLACLYTIRIVAGATAIHVQLSFWLFTFSVFFFLSLAYLKRYTELSADVTPGRLVKGRGYLPEDLRVVETSGISAGMISILVLALFINSLTNSHAYATPELLWLLCLPLLYWINRVWMMARRGQVDGDPVAFAIKDRRSLLTGAFMAVIVLIAQRIHLDVP